VSVSHCYKASALARALVTVPSVKRPARPISVSQLQRYLRSPYDLGKITNQGVEYDGAHPPLIPTGTWLSVVI
jgi:site-specific DNA recombinase